MLCDGESLPIEPRAFDLLVYLVQHRDRAVPKDELIECVWRGRVVTDGVLYRCVKLVRESLSSLGDGADVLRTVHRVGYRLMTPVVELAGGLPAAQAAATFVAVAGNDIELPETAEAGSVYLPSIDAGARVIRYSDPVAALSFVLHQQSLNKRYGLGIHFGRSDGEDPFNPSVAVALALGARPNQILTTAAAFEQFRTYGGGDAASGADWLAHGPYRLVEPDLATSLFEVGVRPIAPMSAPLDTPKLHRSGAEDVILGWRAAPDQHTPGREHWRLTECLGEGGFGEAWLAQHDKTKERRVFKFCYRADRLRSLQREVTLFRLLNETLGVRPDIARILDWNFDVAPYYVESEFSESGDLVQWAEEQGGLKAIPVERRLQIIADIAEALAAAHSVGVLHKDIKPANILVRETTGGAAQPVLADFGVGLIADRSALNDLNITRMGLSETASEIQSSSRSGTRRYMAPEVLEGKPPSIQADIYSLGVVAYQLAVGDFTRVLAPGWERDVDDELVRGDIADMVDGDPLRRLADAGAVARRLTTLQQRRDARVAAAEARRRRDRERARRRVIIPVAVLAIALAGLLSVQNYRIGKERTRAELAAADAQREAAKAKSVARFINDLFDAANPIYEAETPSVVDFLDSGAQRIENRLADQLDVRAELERTLGTAYTALGNFDQAQSLLERSIEDSLASNDVVAEVEARIALASLLREKDQFELAAEQLAAADDALAASPYREDGELRSRLIATRARGIYLASDPANAASMLGQAIAMRAKVVPATDVTLAYMRANRAGYLAAGGTVELSEITALYESALSVLESEVPDSFSYFQILGDFSRHLAVIGRYEEAERYTRLALDFAVRRFGPNHRHTAGLQFTLANMLNDMGEAEQLLLKSLDTRLNLLGNHMITSLSHWALADVYAKSDRWEQAEHHAAEAHTMRLEANISNPGALAETGIRHGSTLSGLGQHARAEAVLREALANALAGPGSEHWLTGQARALLAVALAETNNDAEAQSESQEAMRIIEQRYGPETNMYRFVLFARVDVLVAAGELDEARRLLVPMEDYVDGFNTNEQQQFARLTSRLASTEAN